MSDIHFGRTGSTLQYGNLLYVRDGWQPNRPRINLQEFLGKIFQSAVGQATLLLEDLSAIVCSGGPPFSFDELQQALRQLKVRKAQDAHGLVGEIFKFRSEDLSECLLKIFNSMLHSKNFGPTWQNTLFMMLPKAGDSAQPNNGRPMAIFQITYKRFSEVLYGTLCATLEMERVGTTRVSKVVLTSVAKPKSAIATFGLQTLI